jgi:hypothetical protein
MNITSERDRRAMRKEIDRAFRRMRDQIADRLDEFDAGSLRKQLNQIADAVGDRVGEMQERVQDRVRPQRRRPNPVGLLFLLGSIAGLAFLLYDSRRRAELRGRMLQLQGEARRQLPEVRNRATQAMGGIRARGAGANGGVEQARLKAEVEAAIKADQEALPPQLEVDVEGRTVYLRGSISERGVLDRAVERAQSVDGVAAVINLVSVVPAGR